MIITKYRMIVGKGYVETLSFDEVKSSGYEYITIKDGEYEFGDEIPIEDIPEDSLDWDMELKDGYFQQYKIYLNDKYIYDIRLFWLIKEDKRRLVYNSDLTNEIIKLFNDYGLTDMDVIKDSKYDLYKEKRPDIPKQDIGKSIIDQNLSSGHSEPYKYPVEIKIDPIYRGYDVKNYVYFSDYRLSWLVSGDRMRLTYSGELTEDIIRLYNSYGIMDTDIMSESRFSTKNT